jgi:hypothetical protein
MPELRAVDAEADGVRRVGAFFAAGLVGNDRMKRAARRLVLAGA